MNIVRELYEDTDHPIVFALIFITTLAASTHAVYLIVEDWIATLFAVAVALGMFGLIYYAALDEQPENYRELARWLIDIERPSRQGIILAAGVLILGLVIRIAGTLVESMLLPTTESAGHGSVESGTPEGQAILTVVVLVVFIGPLVEEIVFRGVLQRFLAYVTGGPVAILVASAVFAIGHVPTYGGFGTPLIRLSIPMSVIFLDAVLWGYLYQRTKNVTVPWLAHAGSNAVAVIAWLA